MLKREELLEIVNELNSCYAGSKVGYINGYHDQWFLGGYLNHYKNDLKELRFHFCQGRNTGRTKFNGGYEVTLNVADCKSREEVMEEFRLLDHHKRKEKERLESRCLSCLCALGRITGNCFPNESCGFKKISKKKGMSQIISNRESQSLRV